MADRAPIFASFRDYMGGRLSQTEVDAMDEFLDRFGPKGGTPRTASPDGIALLNRFEGLRLQAYPDPGTGGKPWTIGIGTTVYPDGRGVKAGDTITEAQAEEYLRHDLARFEAAVNKLTGGVTTQPQFDALVSFAYNVGEEALRTSTLLRLHNEGNYSAAAGQFARWNKAAGHVLPGLTKRRAAEAALYRGWKA